MIAYGNYVLNVFPVVKIMCIYVILLSNIITTAQANILNVKLTSLLYVFLTWTTRIATLHLFRMHWAVAQARQRFNKYENKPVLGEYMDWT